MDEKENKSDNVITLNERVISKEELDERMEQVKNIRGVKIIEIVPGKYVERIQG